jgi:hypothetical protein
MPHNILLLEGLGMTELMGFRTLGKSRNKLGWWGGRPSFPSLVWRWVDWGSISTLQKDCFSGYPGWRQLRCDYQQRNSSPAILMYQEIFNITESLTVILTSLLFRENG